MKTDIQILSAAYDAGFMQESNRLNENAVRQGEFELVKELLDLYVPDSSVVVDIGAGPGRYSEYLLSRDCRVGMIDISGKAVDEFREKMMNRYPNQVLFADCCCATHSQWIPENIADAVLLMGPLYHLTNAEERKETLKQCYRMLKKEGYIFSVFMSPYPCLNPHLEMERAAAYNPDYFNSFEKEAITYIDFSGYSVPQYRCWPTEAKNLTESAGFETLRMRNIEGVLTFENTSHNLSLPEKKKLIEVMKLTCEHPALIGVTSQYLHVGIKK